MSVPDGPWLIYALGGGWGHLTRAVSLARLGQERRRIRIMTNSPYATRVAKAMPELDLIVLDPSLETAKARSRAVQEIEASNCSCLIVDTFPRGLGGELANLLGPLKAAKILIHRDLNPRYVVEAGLRDFVQSTYDLVLIPGEDEASVLSDLPAAVITKPWLIRDPQPHREHDGEGCILVCAAGEIAELPWYGTVVSSLLAHSPTPNVRCIAPICPPGCPHENWVEYWPASDLYPEADVIVGGAGYNTIHECAGFQVPLITRPWTRKYDRQWLRAQRAAKRGSVTIVDKPQEAAEAAIRFLRERSSRSSFPVKSQNGAAEALLRIQRLFDGNI